MLTDRTVEISMICGDEEIAKDEDGGMGMEEAEGKFDLLRDRVVSGIQRIADSVERTQEVQLRVVMLKGRVAGEEG